MLPTLADQGYVTVDGFVDRRLASIVHTTLRLRQWRGEVKHDDQVPTALSHWGDPLLDALLVELGPDVERAAGSTLLPTYAYARLYLTGDALARHRDRAACEVAVTVHLGHTGTAPPPICLAAPDAAPGSPPTVAVHQRPGDAVVYLGDRVEHWRDPFTGTDFGQLFLNYVRADGTRTGHRHDGRSDAFPPSLR
jgi:hypothetical protein